MPQKPKFNEAEVQDMVDMFRQGTPIKAIARDMNTTPITVKSYLKKAGLRKTTKKGAPKKAKAAKAAKAAKPAVTAKVAAKPESLANLVAQLKQTESEIAGLQKSIAQAVEKQTRQFEQVESEIAGLQKCLAQAVDTQACQFGQLKQMVNI